MSHGTERNPFSISVVVDAIDEDAAQQVCKGFLLNLRLVPACAEY